MQNSHAFKHLSGTTQTTTNGLSDSYIHKQSKKKEYRTTRQTHSIQVSDVSKHIAEQLGLNDIEISKAEIVALAHDIGHCVFGHDGESAFNEYLNSRSNSNLKDQQEYIKNRRLKLFGKSYENQLNMQDQICGWSSTAKYTYDHAEESAIVLREIVDKDLQEYKGLEGYSEFINEIVQGVLFHSKPAFKTNDNSSQIVSIADSMAFMLDDVNQFLGFGRINEKTANNLLKSAGLNYLNIEFFKDKEKVLNQAIQEVVAFQKQTRNNGKIYNGSHYRDIQWLIVKAVWSCSSNKII